MGIQFKKAVLAPLQPVNAAAPDGALIGLVGETGSGVAEILRLAAGLAKPQSGSVSSGSNRRFLGLTDPFNFAPADLIAIEHAFATHDASVRARVLVALDRMRRAGTTILLASHELDLLRHCCDEVWWLHEGRLVSRGDPATVLDQYQEHIVTKLREWGDTIQNPMNTAGRRGDGRAELVKIETLGTQGRPTAIWRSGEAVEVRVTIRFDAQVTDPVIGMLLRSRIGLDVYGTNTELEGLRFGPVSPGQVVRVSFAFACDLCPQDYTVTAASHDPDGTRHDWLENAVSVSVSDTRYTAGVANLRARVTIA